MKFLWIIPATSAAVTVVVTVVVAVTVSEVIKVNLSLWRDSLGFILGFLLYPIPAIDLGEESQSYFNRTPLSLSILDIPKENKNFSSGAESPEWESGGDDDAHGS